MSNPYFTTCPICENAITCCACTSHLPDVGTCPCGRCGERRDLDLLAMERRDAAGRATVPYVEVDRETVVDHTTRLSFSVRVF